MTKNYRKSSRSKKARPQTAVPLKRAKQDSASKRTTPDPASHPTPARQREILGVLLMAFALLWSLAIVTYNPADEAFIEGRQFWQLFFPEEGSRITNGLGSVGAYLALISVPRFFGFTTLLLNVLAIVWGYQILRRRPLKQLITPSIVVLVAMAFLATVLARVGMDISQWDASVWGGGLGFTSASWTHRVLGAWGSYGTLLVMLIVGLLVFMDRDIQRTLDRVESGARRLRKVLKPVPNQPKGASTSWEELDDKDEAGASPKAPRPAPAEKPPAAPVADAPTQEPSVKGDATEAPPGDIKLKVYGQVEEEKTTVVGKNTTPLGDGVPYAFPPIDLLDRTDATDQKIDFDELEENKRTLLEKLAVYNIEITDIDAIVGPTVTLYELTPAPGVKISRITSLEHDVAMAMAARGIRLIAPIPGKSVVGVEIPNRHREIVRLEQIIGTTKFAEAGLELPMALGKTIEGEVFVQDLAKMPHLLIAGATGSGKSVGLNALITGLLYSCHPVNLKFVMIDPKKIELQQYRELREHYLAIPEDGEEAIITEILDALTILKSCELEMEARYNLLSDARVRGIKEYNQAFHKGRLNPEKGHKHLPYIVVIVDELADLMMTAGKDIEAPIARLAQMARAVGIHMVLATQRPSVDVITGLIKANFPSRVAFQVASKIDARTILDQNGAEQLIGNGDMLYMSGSQIRRLQGPYVSVDEIDRVMDFIRHQAETGPYRLPRLDESVESSLSLGNSGAGRSGSRDALFEEAARIIVRAQQGSVSLLQRKLSIGYTRAARIIDELENVGIVGAYQGAKAREVLIPNEQALDAHLQSGTP